MQKKWKQTGAALLIAGLTITGTSYAWADEKAIEIIDLSQLGKDSTTDVADNSTETETVELPKVESEDNEDKAEDKAQEEVKEDEATTEEESVLPEIPEGYTAGNLVALAKAYEQVQNPTAKASIKRNMERSIKKWESKQAEAETDEQPELETPEQPETVVPAEQPEVKEEPVEEEAPVKEEKPTKVKQEKAPQAQLNAQHKAQREELKATQKAEREALKAERKANKEQQKQEGKEKKN
ncbi:hypothetical protein [Sporosarcina beigongshangi]|uniref:hypothetical protein n=1 Tax=Sporosarcina beigongshangi TaxID=2782538 RepID=UPI001939B3BA|nr:hypothetical protein [Sporosarcina beigongshangi]